MLTAHICKICGRTFDGGPRAGYCSECRKIRRKEHDKTFKLRKNQGEARQIGKLDLCEICNKPYTVESGTQRYCPECAPNAYTEEIRREKKAYYEANKDVINAKRREERKKSRWRLHICEICGKEYFGLYGYGCCSQECNDSKRLLMKERKRTFKHGLPPDIPRIRRKIDWSIVNWEKSNAEISKETGIPMGTIWFARKRFMKAKSE